MDWVMTVEDWAEIRRLHAQEQMSIRAIATHLVVVLLFCLLTPFFGLFLALVFLL